jgi:flagella basal body P-ring formation protein FlgA
MFESRMKIRFLLVLAFFVLGAGAAHANSAVEAARAFLLAKAQALGNNPVVTVRESAASMPACHAPEPFLPGHTGRVLGRITVGVRCDGHKVRYLQARVAVTGRYWVAGQRIPVGTVLAASMLQAREGDLAKLPRHAVLERDAIIGKMTTRSLARDTVVLASALKAPALVHHNQLVTVEADGAGFRITSQGKALQDGGMGATVRVRLANRKVLMGVVSGKNLVEASF